MEGLSEEERKALRGSKFAPLPPPSSSRSRQPKLAHPGGPLKTNKAAALAKFLERKLQDPNGLSSIDPDLVELAVQNAKHSVSSSGTSKSGTIIHHVTSFGDSEPEDSAEEGKVENFSLKNKKKKKKNKKHKKNKKQKLAHDSEDVKLKKPTKKLKL
ncbi:uncharacterized protein LOC8262414 [Ricinus communis]|uniref:Uncharacterized protein n=1 Tax=Ricinus communis TaxID=3988 RepID=B9RT25_RICCO|nr:uncharacterized protein LOC8262414 [Ricinus communis]EEF45508.1 conserved hypothetical protein [Ricinus communis]|eukprot:XP_002516894.1 uncharacterized protein LOC8262414 [Ricinus communis]